MANVPPSAVLFDFGQVLTAPPSAEARARMETLLNAEPKEFHAAYWRFRDAYDRGTLNAPSYWNAVARVLDRKLELPLLQKLIAADTAHWTEPNQPMIEWAQALQAKGVRTGILSNLGDAMEDGVLAALPWLAAFPVQIYSHRFGYAKPDREIYEIAVAELGLPAGEILFVDDRAENVAGARAAGLKAMLYPNHATFVASMQAAGYGALLAQ